MPENRPLTPEELKAIGLIPMNFVVGKERSGTTLLQLMLNAHPNIVAPPEARFIILLYFRYGKTKIWTEKVITNFCDDLFREVLFRNFWGVDKTYLQTTLLSAKEFLNFQLACKIVFKLSSPEKLDLRLFFDKNPIYYYFLPELAKIFPEAKYIHIVRDYRANLVSHRKIFTVKKGTDIAFRWVKVNKLIEEAKSLQPNNYFTITYEALVLNPAQNLEGACSFFNIPFNMNMVENHQSGMFSGFQNNNRERFQKVHHNVFQPINPKLIDEWKEQMTAEELVSVEAVAGEYGEQKYGYKTLNLIKENSGGYFITNLKYIVIKALYRKSFANLWLYYFIKRYVWRHF